MSVNRWTNALHIFVAVFGLCDAVMNTRYSNNTTYIASIAGHTFGTWIGCCLLGWLARLVVLVTALVLRLCRQNVDGRRRVEKFAFAVGMTVGSTLGFIGKIVGPPPGA